ncbi:roquin-2 isoform X2 [Nerophis lumbriciformis]|uniref:roquin-2 isoform X2 n=1 Tax=Nerophis lumbriciformis TaxID=546530 RepID=UPI002AE0223F|nr:roquin-2-like isoform X2 [Nerophis lumbriciformis]
MPVQAAQWTDFLSCPVCYNDFDGGDHQPVSLGCSHTVCRGCLRKLHRKACPFDQAPICIDVDLLPANRALLRLLGAQLPDVQTVGLGGAADVCHYEACRGCVEHLALYLQPISATKGVCPSSGSVLSRPMQRKLVTLVNCQLLEEEGRVRALRAGRSLGERTLTELILQHQNPQQISANLWAAVRARGCQFLGPAMQEEALKLVLLSLEDGSALSRKVLVLFVVQKLEGRFPQASKTSVGHLVQLLYRASCFKVTKRDEDSSLMQLKEEFRAYEALRREHDAQIVHIAMEAGLRISPEQWSSLLYGDLVHKSHMQSIIDKLQSPESFAKSVQELTIVLQRTGDPANLTSLRPHLELLANLDHNPDDPSPSWQEVEKVMLAVKVVVHGLVEFIQNFTKKTQDTPQLQGNSKYKTSMCRDLRHQGGCPRGNNCTFAHTQEELDKFRVRNKKSSSVSHTKTFPVDVQTDDSAGEDVTTQLASARGGPTMEDVTCARGGPTREDVTSSMTSSTSLGSADQSPSSPASPVRHASASPPVGGSDETDKRGVTLRVPHPSHASELIYPGQLHYHTSCSFYAPAHKSCMARFLRSSNVPESSLPPCSFPDHASSSPPSAYTPSRPPPGERMVLFHPHPGQPRYGPLVSAHAVYAPLYDSRRAWRPQLYHREDARSNSLPPEVLQSSIYQPPLRERFNSLDSNYCSGPDHHTGLHRDYGRVPLGYEELFRRKQEQWAHHHQHHQQHHQHHQHHHGANRPAPSTAILDMDFGAEEAGSCPRPWLHSSDHYRRLKEEDPIIPFSEGPIISKWGAISRASRSECHTTDPVLATSFKDCNSQAEHRWSSRGSDSSSHSTFIHSGQLSAADLHQHSPSQRLVFSQDQDLDQDQDQDGVICYQDDDHQESGQHRDIELKLRALDLEDPDAQELNRQEPTDLSSPYSEDAASLLPLSLGEQRHADNPSTDKTNAHLLKKMAFRGRLSPAGATSGGPDKLVLRTGTQRPGGGWSPRSCPEAAMLLGGS